MAKKMTQTSRRDNGVGRRDFVALSMAAGISAATARKADAKELEVVENDVTITFHLGGRVPRFGQKEYFLADMPMSKLAMAEPIGIFIFNGIFDRFPDLRIGSMESGVGWFAWFAEYNDRTWEKQRFWTESPLKNPPSYYMDKNVYGSFIQDRTGILNRDRPGGRNIMWSSDYPHSETTFPKSREIILRDFEGIPEGDVRDIINNNCRRLLGLD